MTILPFQLARALREGGAVERCHTIPHHGSYTVGQHSYDALSLLLVLHPDPTLALVKAVLWHDVPERWTGDVPANAKWDNHRLAHALAVSEGKVFDALGLGPLFEGLSEEECSWLHAVDRLELWLWCQDQLALGNSNVRVVQKNLAEWSGARSAMPDPVWRVLQQLVPAPRTDALPVALKEVG